MRRDPLMWGVRPVRSEILYGDCHEVLRDFDDELSYLIITSPRYADRRAHTYGGVKPDQFVSWFLPRAEERGCVVEQLLFPELK